MRKMTNGDMEVLAATKQIGDEADNSLKLWELLKWQAEKYCGMESTSLPVEKARGLLDSLQFS